MYTFWLITRRGWRFQIFSANLKRSFTFWMTSCLFITAISALCFRFARASFREPVACDVSKQFQIVLKPEAEKETSPIQCLHLYCAEQLSVHSYTTSKESIYHKYPATSSLTWWTGWWLCLVSGEMTKICSVMIDGSSTVLSTPSTVSGASLCKMVTCMKACICE